MLGPSRRQEVAYGVALATMPASRSDRTALAGAPRHVHDQTDARGHLGVQRRLHGDAAIAMRPSFSAVPARRCGPPPGPGR